MKLGFIDENNMKRARDDILVAFDEYFALARDYVAAGYSIFDGMAQITIIKSDVFIVASAVKIHKDFQSVYLLCTYGLIEQAYAVTRTLLDKLLVMKAIFLDPDKYDIWVKDQATRSNRFLMRIKNGEKGLDHLKKTAEKYEPTEDKEQKNMADWAKFADMEDAYNTIYYLFSKYVHPSTLAMNDDIMTDEKGQTVLSAQTIVKDVDKLLLTAIEYLRIALSMVIERCNIDNCCLDELEYRTIELNDKLIKAIETEN